MNSEEEAVAAMWNISPVASDEARRDAMLKAALAIRQNGMHDAIKAEAMLRQWSKWKINPLPTDGEISEALRGADNQPGVDKLDTYNARHVMEEELEAICRGERDPISMPLLPISVGATGFLNPGCVNILGGPVGSCKSYWSLGLCLAADADGVRWAYLSLEMEVAKTAFRIAAMKNGHWAAIDRPQSKGDPEAWMRFVDAVDNQAEYIEAISSSLPPKIKDRHFRNVLRIIQEHLEAGCRLIVVDPYSYIATDDFVPDFRMFLNTVDDLAKKHNATVILVLHTRKDIEFNKHKLLSERDLIGIAEVSQLACSIVMIQPHAEKEGTFMETKDRTVKHGSYSFTLTAPKIREGKSIRSPIAADFGKDGPWFRELGIIIPDYAGEDECPGDRLDLY